jgi:hypothetical protein
VERGTWLQLDDGIEVRFGDLGKFRVGDYWLIPTRGATGDLLWPHAETGQPLGMPPHGLDHHLTPLAVVTRKQSDWEVEQDLRQHFDSLEGVGNRLTAARQELLENIERRDTELQAAIEHRDTELQQQWDRRFEAAEGLGRFRSQDDLSAGDVVAVSREGSDFVELASRENATRVIGVVKDRIAADDAISHFRVTTSGRATCKVEGNVHPGDRLIPGKQRGYARAAWFLVWPGTLLGKVVTVSEATEGMAEVIVALK